MINKELFPKQLQVICQQAWSVPSNTTMNAMIEYILREALEQLILPELDTINVAINELVEEGLQNASQDGGLSESQRNSSTPDKSTRKSSKAGQANGT